VQHLFQGDLSESDDEAQLDRYKDDGDEASYRKRLRKWCIKRIQKRNSYLNQSDPTSWDDVDFDKEWHSSAEFVKDQEFDDGYIMPGDIYIHLFDYQKTCCKWLWELHKQQVGGVLGDEMVLFSY
jgi:DNA excision repair protein ERCC-6